MFLVADETKEIQKPSAGNNYVSVARYRGLTIFLVHSNTKYDQKLGYGNSDPCTRTDLFSIGSKKKIKINNVSHISTVVVQLHKMAAFILFHFDKLAAVLQCPLLSRQKQNNLFC